MTLFCLPVDERVEGGMGQDRKKNCHGVGFCLLISA
jgi:hypothetical protein